jgi:hypothetical protein
MNTHISRSGSTGSPWNNRAVLYNRFLDDASCILVAEYINGLLEATQ